MVYWYCCVLKRVEKGEIMTNDKNVEKYLWISAVMFVTYLLLGSFIVGKNYVELAYLVILYVFVITIKIIERK